MNSRPSRLSIPPQLGTEIGSPNPKKLSAASLIITPPTLIVKMMITGAAILGRTWRMRVLLLVLPIRLGRLKVDVLLHPDNRAPDHSRTADAARHPQHHDDLRQTPPHQGHDGQQQQQPGNAIQASTKRCIASWPLGCSSKEKRGRG